MAGAAGPARRLPVRLILTLLVSGLALVFLWRVVSEVGLHRLGARLSQVNTLLLVSATALTIVRFVLQALRWEVLVRREAPVGLRQVLPILMAGNFLNLVTPALRIAGPILRAYYLSQETGRPRARFYGTIVADQTTNFAVYALAVALGAALVPMPGREAPSPALGAALAGALVGGLAIAYFFLRRIQRGERSLLAQWVHGRSDGSGSRLRARVALWWDHMAEALSHSVLGGGAWWPAMGISVLLFLSIVAGQVVSFAAIGANVGFLPAAFAVAGAGFIQMMAASPGGSGVTEASLIWVFMTMGMDGETAAAGVLLARCLNYAVLLPWGGWSFFGLQRRYGMPRDVPQSDPA
ncbi:MAG: lysylphosphatidylglycerol synthase transmembrane domain-containing protein [Candidatus Polarisedimenticolia bacterium]